MMKTFAAVSVLAVAGAAHAVDPGEQFVALGWVGGEISLSGNLYNEDASFALSQVLGGPPNNRFVDTSDSFFTFGGGPLTPAGASFQAPGDVTGNDVFPVAVVGDATANGVTSFTIEGAGPDILASPVTSLAEAAPSVTSSLLSVGGVEVQAVYLGQITSFGSGGSLTSVGAEVRILAPGDFEGTPIITPTEFRSAVDTDVLGFQLVAVASDTVASDPTTFEDVAATSFQLYAVNNIPTPGAAGLLGLAGLAVARRRRA